MVDDAPGRRIQHVLDDLVIRCPRILLDVLFDGGALRVGELLLKCFEPGDGLVELLLELGALAPDFSLLLVGFDIGDTELLAACLNHGFHPLTRGHVVGVGRLGPLVVELCRRIGRRRLCIRHANPLWMPHSRFSGPASSPWMQGAVSVAIGPRVGARLDGR